MGVTKITTATFMKLMLYSRKTLWFVWQDHVNGRFVYVFGLESTDQPR